MTAPLGRRVLVVDDLHDMTDSMAILLRLLGHDVRVAYDGLHAITVAREFLPDVVLLDLGMTEMRGYDVAKRLRREPTCKDALLVAVTGYGMEEDRHRTSEAGFDAHLLKPADLGTLKALLASGRHN